MNSEAPRDLPVYTRLDEITGTLAREGMLILNAETGSGKTTIVPWGLLRHSSFHGRKIILMEPRRIAARAAADRIARLLGEKTGHTVGLRTRTETIVGPGTVLEVVTYGVFIRIIQNDQELAGYGTLIFDEFHERRIPTELSFAFAMECRETIRPDLRMLFMSATAESDVKAAGGKTIPRLSIPGRPFPVRVEHRPPLPGERPWDGAARLVDMALRCPEAERDGDILVFLPGWREIGRTGERLTPLARARGLAIVALHGSLPPGEQRRVLEPPRDGERRVILATNIAETSLTIPGVRAVVDSGLERRVRHSPRTGMNHWETVEISRASAEQRRGRAGRLGPGACCRWWPEGKARSEFTPPEMLEEDLAPLLMETLLWGASSPGDLTWLTPPPDAALRRAAGLLRSLGLTGDDGRLTESGRHAAGLGVHPRLGRMIVEARRRGWLSTAAITAALLEERFQTGKPSPDFRDLVAAWREALQGPGSDPRRGAARRILDNARRIFRAAGAGDTSLSPDDADPGLVGRLLLLAYPDRAARNTGPGRWLTATGRAARLEGHFAGDAFLVAADLDGGETDARILLGAPITPADLEIMGGGSTAVERAVEWEGWTPRVRSRLRYGAITLRELPAAPPGDEELRAMVTARLGEKGIESLPWGAASRRLLARCVFIQNQGGVPWPDFSPESLAREAPSWLLPFARGGGGPVFTEASLLRALERFLGRGGKATLDSLAPERITLPSGARKLIDYETGETPVLAAKIQELFGCERTPTLCGRPLLVHLLSPAGRPVQITDDLAGFWKGSYREVRKELRGRYPRHSWPTDPGGE